MFQGCSKAYAGLDRRRGVVRCYLRHVLGVKRKPQPLRRRACSTVECAAYWIESIARWSVACCKLLPATSHLVCCSLFVVRCKAADAPCLKNFARSRLSTSARSEMVTSTAAAVTGSKRTCSAAVSIREVQPVEPRADSADYLVEQYS